MAAHSRIKAARPRRRVGDRYPSDFGDDPAISRPVPPYPASLQINVTGDTLHDQAVYLPLSYMTSIAVARSTIEGVTFGATKNEIPLETIRPAAR